MDHLEDVWYAMLKDPLPQLNCLMCAINYFFFVNLGTNVMLGSLSLCNQKIEFCVLNGVSA